MIRDTYTICSIILLILTALFTITIADDTCGIGIRGQYIACTKQQPHITKHIPGGELFLYVYQPDGLTALDISCALMSATYNTVAHENYIDSYSFTTVEYSYVQEEVFLPISLGINLIRNFNIYTPPKEISTNTALPFYSRLTPYAGGGITMHIVRRTTTVLTAINPPKELAIALGNKESKWYPLTPALTVKGGFNTKIYDTVSINLDVRYQLFLADKAIRESFLSSLFTVSLGVLYHIDGKAIKKKGADPIHELDF